jgi:ATP-dependent 26S proteasome regulatory subunit
LSIIQGPPGTGKTEVVKAIAYLFQNYNAREIAALEWQARSKYVRGERSAFEDDFSQQAEEEDGDDYYEEE